MQLNCVGDVCPIPVIKTKKALAEIGESGVVSVTVDNAEAVENIEKMVKSFGYGYETGRDGENFIIKITKGSGVIETEGLKAKNGRVIVISSDKMGAGSDELGAALMKTFIYTLTESGSLPDAVIFYNGGVKLTTEGSASLNDLATLAENGVDILSCGACLNYYNLTGSLKAGRVTNMYEIVELMQSSSAVVRP